MPQRPSKELRLLWAPQLLASVSTHGSPSSLTRQRLDPAYCIHETGRSGAPASQRTCTPSLELNYDFNNHREEVVLPGTGLSASPVRPAELSTASKHQALLSKISWPNASLLPLSQGHSRGQRAWQFYLSTMSYVGRP